MGGVFKRHLLATRSRIATCGETHPTHTTRNTAEVECPRCLEAIEAKADEYEYRIEYQIQRKRVGDDIFEFVEIGFGSSGHESDIDAALYAVQSDIQTRHWETTDGMPGPGDA